MAYYALYREDEELLDFYRKEDREKLCNILKGLKKIMHKEMSRIEFRITGEAVDCGSYVKYKLKPTSKNLARR